VRTVVWQGIDEPRMEIARIELVEGGLRAFGTQIGVAYELRYDFDGSRLRLEVVGERTTEIELDREFFDLGFSPLFNSLPVLRDRLLEGGPARDYVMRWVSVPDLGLHESQQRYEPIGDRRVRFVDGSFVADLEFDEDGLVTRYPGLAERVG
jgi:hypothetical protein